MLHPFDFYPFNVPAGTEFLGIYAVTSIVVLLATYGVREAVARGIDRAHRPTVAPAPGGSYRGGAAGDELQIGDVPRPDQVLALAYLFGGTTQVSFTLIATALAEGWLSPELVPCAVPRTSGHHLTQMIRIPLVMLNVAGVQYAAALRYQAWYPRQPPSAGSRPFTEIGASPASG